MKRGYASMAAIPLTEGDAVIGSLNIYSDKADGFDADEMRLLSELAADLSFGIRHHRMSRERERTEKLRAESEMRYRSFFEQSPFGVLVVDMETALPLEFNDTACRQLGYTREEFARLRVGDYEAKETPEETKRHFADILSKGGASFETKHRAKGGGIRDVLITARVITLAGKSVTFCIFQDITERKIAEETLRMSEARLNEAQRIGKLGFLDWDLITNEIECSDETLRIYGLDAGRKKVKFEEIAKLVHPDDVPLAVKSMNNAIEKGVEHHIEHRIVRPDGTVIYVDTRGEVIRDANGKPIRMLGTNLDITERKRTEELLRTHHAEMEMQNEELRQTREELEVSRAKYFDLYNLAPAGYFTISGQGVILEANLTAANLLGIERKALVGQPFIRFIIPGDQDVHYLFRKQLFETAKPQVCEVRIVRPDGGLLWARLEAAVAGDAESGAPVCHAVMIDITERRMAEDELLASERALSEAQALAHLGNWEMDLQTGKGTWSDESYRIFGFEPGAFEPAFDKFISLIHPEDRKIIEDYLPDILSGKLRQAEFNARIIRPDGQERVVHDKLEVMTGKDGKPVKIIGVNFDITERKMYERKLEIANHDLTAALEQVRQTQAVLMRSEKLSAVGTLSAGVAHEILNPLNIIGTICQLLLLDERSGRLHDNLEEIMLQIQRAAKITNSLRMFARENKMDITPVDLQKLFDHTAKLMEHDLNLDNIFVDRQYDPNAPLILADADQLAQVFMNLLTNARDILQPRRGGMITAATRAVKNGIEFTFRDNGPGMPEDVVDRIFDPFFTTKEPGKGTGLGLSVVHGIIEGHGGTISVESREGEGTCFTIFLPKEGGPLFQAKKTV